MGPQCNSLWMYGCEVQPPVWGRSSGFGVLAFARRYHVGSLARRRNTPSTERYTSGTDSLLYTAVFCRCSPSTGRPSSQRFRFDKQRCTTSIPFVQVVFSWLGSFRPLCPASYGVGSLTLPLPRGVAPPSAHFVFLFGGIFSGRDLFAWTHTHAGWMPVSLHACLSSSPSGRLVSCYNTQDFDEKRLEWRKQKKSVINAIGSMTARTLRFEDKERKTIALHALAFYKVQIVLRKKRGDSLIHPWRDRLIDFTSPYIDRPVRDSLLFVLLAVSWQTELNDQPS